MEFSTSFAAEWLLDIGALREGALMLEEGGIDVVGHGGHVLSAREGRFDRPPSTYARVFRDPLVLYAHLAAITTRLRFRSGILILPLFPTAHVAKQAADLAAYSGGRFELGVGISWNDAEYEAMGQDLSKRGRRLDEQLAVLRKLWSEPFVSFDGEFHHLDDLGIGEVAPYPIPIWIGCGDSDRALRRVGALADGWMPIGAPSPERIDALQHFAAEAGRSEPIRVSGRLLARAGDDAAVIAEASALVGAGVSSIAIGPPPGSSVLEGIATVIATRALLREAL